MKQIQKKISLEQFKSRMPSIIPAFYANGKTYEFDGKVNFNDEGERIPYTNYGMIPYSVIWDRGIYNGKCISYNKIASWFHFIEFYIGLLTSNSCSSLNYKNAVDYSKYEININYDNESYKSFDSKIIEICGTSNGNTLYENAVNTYNTMVSKFFPRFIIDENLQKYWNKKYLSIDDVNYWIEWLGNVSNEIGNDVNINKCKDTNNCCDCEKFFNLGGYEMLNKLKNFINGITKQSALNYCKPFISINILLSTSIDDLGEFSIFYEDWEGGTDYSESNGELTNGTVVKYNNQDWILNKGKGYIYSKEFKEYYFGTESGMTIDEAIKYNENDESNLVGEKNQLSRFIEKNAFNENKIKRDFNGNINLNNKYTYSFNNKIIFFNDFNNDLYKSIYQRIPITHVNNGFFYIKGKIYESKKIDYINYNGNFYEIDYDTENNPISKVNGINYYGLFNGKNFIFNIDKKDIYISSGNGIVINNNLIIEANNKLYYQNYTYNKIYNYANINNEIILLNNDLNIVSQKLNNNEFKLLLDNKILGENLNSLTNKSNGYITDDKYIYIVQPFTVYNANEITGYTESKLSSFITTTDIVYDNLGNKLPGTYLEERQLKDGDFIGLVYKPNTTLHLSKEYDENGNIINNRYWGDYLSEIILYYVDYNNNIITSEKPLNENGNLITIINELKNELNGKDGKLFCKFIYYMGCVMNISKCGESNCIEIIDNGVKYIDVTELTEETCKYFLNDYTCYTIKYYNIIHDEINYKNSVYNFNSCVNKSQFSMQITSFTRNNNFITNGWVDFPVIREEYRLGSSSLSNVDVDVNIDRGTARAFDQHIKLLEVNSLESLEQYGNGYFNIITN